MGHAFNCYLYDCKPIVHWLHTTKVILHFGNPRSGLVSDWYSYVKQMS